MGVRAVDLCAVWTVHFLLREYGVTSQRKVGDPWPSHRCVCVAGAHFRARVDRTLFLWRVRSGGAVENCDLRTFPIPLRDPSAANSIVLSSLCTIKLKLGLRFAGGVDWECVFWRLVSR